ncbi:bacteriohemerythrin [Nitrospirota bacterium]
MTIYWDDDKYSVQNVEMDNQHKGLFQLAIQLESALQEDREDGQLNLFIIELQRYFNTHFGFEEEIMEAEGYERSEEHLEAHERFIHLMERVVGDEDSDNSTKGIQMLFLINEWIENHIGEMDRQLATFLINRPSP